jgi:hypothetical protein
MHPKLSDSHCLFSFFGVVAPEKVCVQVAFKRISTHKQIMELPIKKSLVGNATYQVSNVIFVSLTGSKHKDPAEDAFNFVLSQLCICFVMVLVLLQTKRDGLNRLYKPI